MNTFFNRNKCSEVGCLNAAKSMGLCGTHYMRGYRSGIRKDVVDTTKFCEALKDDPTTTVVHLTKGYKAYIDTLDAERVSKYSWAANEVTLNYVRATSRVNGKQIYLHQFILNVNGLTLAKDGLEIDHEDRNPLNNRRSNLRIVTREENVYNKSRSLNKIGYCWNKRAKLFYVYLDEKGKKRKNLGYTKTEDQAKARVEEARNK